MKCIYKIIFCIFHLTFLAVDETNSKDINWAPLYDPDSLAVISLLDSNNLSHDIFWDVVWYLIKVTVQDTEWRIIRLYFKKLPTPIFCIPPEIKNLNRLGWLELAHHNLEHVPIEIAEIEWMYVLDFRYNPLKEIPAELAQCPKLDYLGLAYTKITSLPDEFLDLDLRPCNIAVDTISGNIYPRNVIDLCGLENFTLTERQKAWAGVADYEEYKQKYCQETAVKEPDVNSKKPVASGIHAVVTGYTLRLTLKREGVLSLSLFNSSGRQVSVIFRRKSLSKGSHSIQLKNNITPLVYFIRVKIGGMRFSRRVVVTGGI